jgi:hypothetical protein
MNSFFILLNMVLSDLRDLWPGTLAVGVVSFATILLGFGLQGRSWRREFTLSLLSIAFAPLFLLIGVLWYADPNPTHASGSNMVAFIFFCMCCLSVFVLSIYLLLRSGRDWWITLAFLLVDAWVIALASLTSFMAITGAWL